MSGDLVSQQGGEVVSYSADELQLIRGRGCFMKWWEAQKEGGAD